MRHATDYERTARLRAEREESLIDRDYDEADRRAARQWPDDPANWSFEMLLDNFYKERAARTELENRLRVLSTRAQSLADRKWAAAAVHVGKAILSGLAVPTR